MVRHRTVPQALLHYYPILKAFLLVFQMFITIERQFINFDKTLPEITDAGISLSFIEEKSLYLRSQKFSNRDNLRDRLGRDRCLTEALKLFSLFQKRNVTNHNNLPSYLSIHRTKLMMFEDKDEFVLVIFRLDNRITFVEVKISISMDSSWVRIDLFASHGCKNSTGKEHSSLKI
uniref:Uncharacterized protein n=1 Tax=Glossina brevipalpis TaxID=37001 RepID=A0A1A9WFS3_9MUSC